MKVVSVNISDRKGIAKEPVDAIDVRKYHGIIGDAHAAPGIRQISMLAKESYERFEKQGSPCLKNGSFGENIVTEGIDLHMLPVGTHMKIGTAVLEVSKIGKECHAPCAISKAVGECIMPKEGIFAIVINEGRIVPGDHIILMT